MKRHLILLLSVISGLFMKAQTVQISGTVCDEKQEPLIGVNVYIDGTLDGTSTNNKGAFVIETEEKGIITIIASYIGYQPYSVTREANELSGIHIQLKPAAQQLQDVVIVAGNYSLKSSTLEGQDAITLVMTAGSEGDLYKSLTMLPGTQIPGTDGRLRVRGGDSRESQTFIDGMHVLAQYTANSPNSSSRSKYSTFHFDGINFSTGGYSPEYSQSLSSILPLDTKNESKTKYGFGLMNVSMEGGATQAWDKGSNSFSLTYTDMTFYNATLYPGEKKKWDIPYRDFSVRNQLRFNFDDNTILKAYYGYDKTRYKRQWEDAFATNPRNMDYDENNIYLNTTFRKKFDNMLQLFAGAAYSWNRKEIGSSVISGDKFVNDENEVHLKAKASKRFTNLYKLEAGAESYLKTYDMHYTTVNRFEGKINNNISGAFVSNDFNFIHKFFFNLSGRMEYSSLNDEYSFLPRAALNYHWNGVTMSAIVGKYQQAVSYDYLLSNQKLHMETNLQTMLGFYYHKDNRIYRAEFYNKKYDKLPLYVNEEYTSTGNGYSRGIDLYMDDRQTFKKVNYVLTYSYNDSKRKYLRFPEKATPEFVTRHNASISINYAPTILKSYFSFGMTNRFASGRPYHNPNKTGFMNSETPSYHTLDLSLTVLPHKNVIVYACLSNVLNRDNIYGYNYSSTPDLNGKFAAQPVTIDQKQAFYIGVFINLGKNAVYSPTYF